jgi:cell shape-determining protein MreC
MQDQPSRLDRIESALEIMQQRMDQEFESQMALNADFRTRHELVMQEIASLKEANQIALERDREQSEMLRLLVERTEVQSENIRLLADRTEAQSQDIRAIAESVQLIIGGLRQHASDGHGA